MADLSADLGKLKLKNPVMTASGTCGYGSELADFFDSALLGAVVAKGLSLEPRPGNPPPRMTETPSGMLNAIGLENVGLKKFIQDKLPWLVERGVTVVANILGETAREYEALAKALGRESGVAMIEVNVSCPNVEAGGLSFGTDPEATARVVEGVVNQARGKPVMVKLTPMVSDIAAVARAAVRAGADVISLINTIPAMAVDITTRKPALKNIVGG
ncbi:MAG: dihydroorotate dehydrogenase, partial [Deltaproteobacteria bacterium]|nr:dihydroorotate dehydrogenase [Deltaproteobacteria bacterium]